METTDQTANTAAALARAIPPLPGGGSWRFDEPRWAWFPSDLAPEAEPTTNEV